ncbi:hypothetical protein E1264_27360 [Actinomadura sp. KC216]|uniref:hypothetical protein n=1 Tax=Actinomadura sp. KC216 TaxID=2530370 RepID=UPI001046E191|nr:hypothetical protein [Actinomadura sp. KC216]TDB83713.1 hypothetical protein E1264_27360 [Actinomadura sp. KC216]
MNESVTEQTRALGALIERLAAEAGTTADRAAGLRFIGDLNRALDGLPGLLAAARALLDRTDLGPVLATRLDAAWTEAETLRAELIEAEGLAERLGPALAELADVKARHADLTARLAEVRRLDALKGEVETLRSATSDLYRREAELSGVRGAERELAEAAAPLEASAALRLAELDTETRRAVERAERLAGEVTSAERRLAVQRGAVTAREDGLAALQTQFAELQDIADRTLPRIEAHRRADRELCAALGVGLLTKGPGLEHLQAALDEMEERLRQTDDALREALRARDADHAEARKPLGLV